MVKLDKKVMAALRMVLEQHKDAETLGPDGHVLYNAMADTVSNGGDLSALSIDPFSLPTSSWYKTHPTVRAGLSALVSLEAVLTWAETSKSSQPANLVLGPLRDGWFDIVNWLEFALPARGPLPLDRAYFRVCINLLRHFFRLKKHLADLLGRSRQVHAWTMALWCCLWLKVDEEEMIWDYGHWMTQVNDTISLMVKPVAPKGNKDDYDHDAMWEALAAVGHRSNRVHRFIILGITQLIDFTMTGVSSKARDFFMRQTLSVIQKQLCELERFFVAMEVTKVRERDVEALVDVVRKLHNMPGGNDVACYALDLLVSFWDWERRSVAWSLKAGLFPLVASLWRPEANISCSVRGKLIKLLFLLGSWTAYFPVAVAFQRYCAGESLETAGVLQDPYVKIMPQWYQAHAELMKRCEIVEDMFRPKCFNWRCPAKGKLEGVRVKSCTCYDAFYCSEACQKQHWPMHRCFCPLIDRSDRENFKRIEPVIRTDRGFLNSKDAHFVKLLTRNFINENGQRLLDTIHKVRLDNLSADGPAYVVALCVRFDGQVSSFQIQLYPGVEMDSVDPERSDEENVRIHVTAQVAQPRRRKRPLPLVEVMVLTMWELRDRAEHFKTCTDHAACVARVQGRPPRCEKLETLGRRCDQCPEVYGPDEDPWGAPGPLECMRATY
ncbi:hypothetical protein GGF50DRAFT_107714 [Schizophyllum commune]